VVIPKNLFPTQDTGQLSATIIAANDTGFARMSRLQGEVADALLKDPAVDSLSSSVGVDGINPMLSQGRMLINLKSVAARPPRHGDRRPAGARGAGARREALSPAGAGSDHRHRNRPHPYRFALKGADQNAVNEWGNKLAGALQGEPALRDVNAQVLARGRSVVVDINRDAAARLGVTALTIDNALYDAFGQRIISTIYTQSSQNRVILQGTPQMISDPSGLAQLYIPLSSGTQVPLGTVASVHESEAPLVLARESQFPQATIGFDLAPGVSLGHAVAQIERVEKQIGLPASVTTDFSGSASAFQRRCRMRACWSPPPSWWSISCWACSMRASSIPSRSSPPCPRRASAR
jgi:multidrug efflux pump